SDVGLRPDLDRLRICHKGTASYVHAIEGRIIIDRDGNVPAVSRDVDIVAVIELNGLVVQDFRRRISVRLQIPADCFDLSDNIEQLATVDCILTGFTDLARP